MTRTNVLAAGLACAWLLLAQSVTKPAFEVVSIRPLSSSARPTGKKAQSDAGMLRYSGIPMLRLIANAYQVETYQVIGPSWLQEERYEINAKLPADSTRDQIPLMLQAMLSDRFHFASHSETREIPVYALVVGKGGPKMRTAEVRDSQAGTRMLSITKREFKGRTDLDEFIFLLKVGDRALADRPILNMTGLSGLFDIQLDWSVDNPAPSGSSASDAGPDIFSAIQDQLGLKLEPRKSPLKVVVVDRVERVPTEN